jgi:UDP-3-O-[3-hydroxymyristoyl] glucosamine N-acyltransferase
VHVGDDVDIGPAAQIDVGARIGNNVRIASRTYVPPRQVVEDGAKIS